MESQITIDEIIFFQKNYISGYILAQCEGLHPMCPANAYTLVRATLHCQDTVGIMLLDFLCLTKPSKRAVRRE